MRLASWLARSMRKGQSRRDLTAELRQGAGSVPDDVKRITP
jgi:hypothetical protein